MEHTELARSTSAAYGCCCATRNPDEALGVELDVAADAQQLATV
jgi:hypothetical protein